MIARKFGRRVLIVSDTMISDAALGRADAIPGRLKSIILSPTVSVAYAGHSNPALHAIRAARHALLETGSVSSVTDVLVDLSADPAFDVDFIVVFHDHGVPRLHKITAGIMTDDVSECFVGNSAVVTALVREVPANPGIDQPDLGIEAAEGTFWNAFNQLFLKRGVALTDGVGGVAIGLVASPFGHHYIRQAVVIAWDHIDLGRGITPAQHMAQRSGETAWIVETISASLRGIGIVGVGLPQAGIGFIHSPLTSDDPESLSLGPPEGAGFINSAALQLAMQRRADELAALVGGGVIEVGGEEDWLSI